MKFSAIIVISLAIFSVQANNYYNQDSSESDSSSSSSSSSEESVEQYNHQKRGMNRQIVFERIRDRVHRSKQMNDYGIVQPQIQIQPQPQQHSSYGQQTLPRPSYGRRMNIRPQPQNAY